MSAAEGLSSTQSQMIAEPRSIFGTETFTNGVCACLDSISLEFLHASSVAELSGRPFRGFVGLSVARYTARLCREIRRSACTCS